MKFTVNMLLTCIIYCDAGTGCLIKVQYVDSYHGYHIFPHTFFFGEVVVIRLSRDVLMFLAYI